MRSRINKFLKIREILKFNEARVNILIFNSDIARKLKPY